MKLTEQDKQILKDLCTQHNVNYDKVLKLIETEEEYLLRGNRVGIYDALKEIIKPSN